MPRNILTQAQAVEIYARKKQCRTESEQTPNSPVWLGASAAAVAHEYNVSPKAVRDIWNRRSWTRETRHLWQQGEVEFIRKVRASAEKPAYPLIGLATSYIAAPAESLKRKGLKSTSGAGFRAHSSCETLTPIDTEDPTSFRNMDEPTTGCLQPKKQTGFYCEPLHLKFGGCFFSTERSGKAPSCSATCPVTPAPPFPSRPSPAPSDRRPSGALAAAPARAGAAALAMPWPAAAATAGPGEVGQRPTSEGERTKIATLP